MTPSSPGPKRSWLLSARAHQTPTANPPGKEPSPGANLLFASVAGVAAFALVVARFAPRFIHWNWIDLDSSEHHPPEFNRAIDTLRQLEHPLVPIANPTNIVINWRLLFPMVGHLLRLPPWAFLALPWLGCLLVLGVCGDPGAAKWGNEVGGDRGGSAFGNDVMVLCLDGLARLLRLLVRAGFARRDVFTLDGRRGHRLSAFAVDRREIRPGASARHSRSRHLCRRRSMASPVSDFAPRHCFSWRYWHLIAG